MGKAIHTITADYALIHISIISIYIISFEFNIVYIYNLVCIVSTIVSVVDSEVSPLLATIVPHKNIQTRFWKSSTYMLWKSVIPTLGRGNYSDVRNTWLKIHFWKQCYNRLIFDFKVWVVNCKLTKLKKKRSWAILSEYTGFAIYWKTPYSVAF